MFHKFLTAFIPIFVAIDAIGIVPTYLGLVHNTQKNERNKILIQAILTAILVGIGFVILGKKVFLFLGITVQDFQIAGGIVLLVLSIHDLLFSDKIERSVSDTLGVVPLGIPLIVGPATLTAITILSETVGERITLLSFGINVLITYVILRFASVVVRVLGKGGTQAMSKVASLLLASIAVMIIRSGVIDVINQNFIK
jgi:multiple antibiotic resistance protein